MPLELLLQRGPPRRVVCVGDATHRAMWPYFFASAVRPALPLCRWAAAHGAAAHGALRLQYDDARGCHLVVTRALPRGCALLSLPTSLALTATTAARHNNNSSSSNAYHDDDDDDDSDGDDDARCLLGSSVVAAAPTADASRDAACKLRFLADVERLASVVARHLHDRRSRHRVYLELLHDLYNADADAELHAAVAATVTATTRTRAAVATTAAAAAAQGGGGDEVLWSHSPAATTALLQARVADMYGGNALHMRGVCNAPFLDKATLQSPRQRVTWSRVRALRRRLEQSLPYFAVHSAAWAVSMALSRTHDCRICTACPTTTTTTTTASDATARHDDGDRRHRGALAMLPLIDFCSHSRDASACLHICHRRHRRRGDDSGGDAPRACGVRGHDARVRCVHVCTTRPLARGDEVTLCYSDRGVTTADDADYWRLRYGFVPPA